MNNFLGFKTFAYSKMGWLALLQFHLMCATSLMANFAQSNETEAPRPSVTGFSATRVPWEITLHSAGTAQAFAKVGIRAELDGILRRIYVQSGENVKAGQILFSQDSSIEEADLGVALANEKLSEKQLVRLRSLLKSNGISEESYDLENALYEARKSEVRKISHVIEKKVIRAPFDGKIGIIDLSEGHYLHQGEEISTLYEMHRIKVEVKIPQIEIHKINVGQKVQALIDGVSHYGEVTALSPELDKKMRTMRVVTVFENDQRQLLPGMFVELIFSGDKSVEALVVPVSAVKYSPSGTTLAVLIDRKKYYEVDEKHVVIGDTRGDFVEIVSGITEGDVVVSTGAFKVHSGQKVLIDNSMSPSFSSVSDLVNP